MYYEICSGSQGSLNKPPDDDDAHVVQTTNLTYLNSHGDAYSKPPWAGNLTHQTIAGLFSFLDDGRCIIIARLSGNNESLWKNWQAQRTSLPRLEVDDARDVRPLSWSIVPTTQSPPTWLFFSWSWRLGHWWFFLCLTSNVRPPPPKTRSGEHEKLPPSSTNREHFEYISSSCSTDDIYS